MTGVRAMDLGETAIYMRLSRDDERAGEPTSIENQRAILTRYAEEHGGKIAGEYVDDGWSGTNFERPAVKKLLSDARDGKIETILVKDLSRFGRNYIEVGQYTDYIFPAYGIRFIAIADNVDTAERSGAAMDMMPIMNVFNEWHAANTSRKIRAVLQANWRRGRYTSWAYPYGYVAANDEKRTAIRDEDAARVVQRIFDMRLQGRSLRAIARALSDEGIPTPSLHHAMRTGKHCGRGGATWSAKTVGDILKDETYTGTLTQHRTTNYSYKNKRVEIVPQAERVIIAGAHEAIVSRELFERVQNINNAGARGRADKGRAVHPLSGLLICADCGRKMKFARGGAGRFICRTYADLGKKYCSSHSVAEGALERAIAKDLRELYGGAELFGAEHLARALKLKQDRQKAQNAAELRALKGRLAELDKLIRKAFEAEVYGKLPSEACRSLCEKYLAEKKASEGEIAELEKAAEVGRPAENDPSPEGACPALTREACLQLIDRVVVGGEGADGRRIEIFYKFSPPPQ